MSASAAQTRLELVNDAEHKDRVDRAVDFYNGMMAVIRRVVVDHGGYDKVAAQIDAVWGDSKIGRGVSGSTFKAAVSGAERNYCRIEWIQWLADNSVEFADFLRGVADGRTEKTVEDENRDLKEIIRRKYPEDAEAIIRKAKTMRTRR